MSWSVIFIGTPQNIINALNEQSEKLSGQSKAEFDDALPHMRELLAQNHAPQAPILRLTASGSGWSNLSGESQNSCLLNIEQLYGELV